jgi:hypothetical protein
VTVSGSSGGAVPFASTALDPAGPYHVCRLERLDKIAVLPIVDVRRKRHGKNVKPPVNARSSTAHEL